MMAVLIALLTLLMVADCVILILLVLIQLPKKEAGAGVAFGGSATDALFGAGSGTVLTKITKYAAAGFFLMAMILSLLQSNYHRRTSTEFEKKLGEAGSAPLALPVASPSGSNALVANTNALNVRTAEATNTVTSGLTSSTSPVSVSTNLPTPTPPPQK